MHHAPRAVHHWGARHRYLHEFLTELLSADGRLSELYQLLQYRVTSDSIQLATRSVGGWVSRYMGVGMWVQ